MDKPTPRIPFADTLRAWVRRPLSECLADAITDWLFQPRAATAATPSDDAATTAAPPALEPGQTRRVVFGIVLIGVLVTGALIWRAAASYITPATTAVPAAPSTPAAQASDARAAVYATIAGYNQAAIHDGRSATTTAMADYVDPASQAWTAITRASVRAQQANTRTDATLVRWAIVQEDVTDATAIVTLQESWSVRTYGADRTLVASTREQIARVTYTLARHSTTWRITELRRTPTEE